MRVKSQPFGDDGFGNDIWINLSSGSIKKYITIMPPFN